MRYAIIGAGIAGLTAAWEVHRRDPQAAVEVFEATDRIGGKVFSVPFDDGPVDMGAEAFLVSRPAVVELIDELGLRSHIVGTSGASSTVYTGRELKPLPGETAMGIPATSAPVAHLVSEETARRIDAEGDADPIDWTVGGDVNVGRLVRERYGDDVADRVVSALLGGVYSCTADDLGLRATVPQLAEALDELATSDDKVTLSAAAQKVLDAKKAARAAQPTDDQPSVFGSFAGGLRELYEELAEQSKAKIYLDAFVSGARRAGEGFQLTGAGEGTYNRLMMATPAPTTAKLVRDLAPGLTEALAPIKLAGSVVVGLKLDSDNGFPEHSGVLVAADETDMHVKAFTFSSRKWPHLARRGGVTLRASFGRFGDDSVLRADEDTLVDWALDDLKTATGFDARAAGVSEIFVQRWHGGIPRYDEEHLATVARARDELARIPGLEATGAWAGGVGIPAVITDARAAASRFFD